MLGIVAVGVVRESRKFRAAMAHRAVIFATAQLSCKLFLYIKVYVIAYTLQRPLSLLTVWLVTLILWRIQAILS